MQLMHESKSTVLKLDRSITSWFRNVAEWGKRYETIEVILRGAPKICAGAPKSFS